MVIHFGTSSGTRPHSHRNMTLVHNFGSTPVVTRTYQAAAYLAEYSYHNDPPGGLRWVNECPDDIRASLLSNGAWTKLLPRYFYLARAIVADNL
jgi:hypothetical protein